jgi:hypothetical protein
MCDAEAKRFLVASIDQKHLNLIEFLFRDGVVVLFLNSKQMMLVQQLENVLVDNKHKSTYKQTEDYPPLFFT